MRQKTYEMVIDLNKKYHGYIRTMELLKEGLTNRQIGVLQEEGYLEKIANGSFWLSKFEKPKPADHKAIEVCMVNERAVIIGESALYYQGFIDVEPQVLAIATKRTDRHQMHFPFDVNRHYFAVSRFDDGLKKVKTKFGNYNIYDLDRSICDCIRFQDEVEGDVLDLVIEKCQKQDFDEARKTRMLEYAKSMKFEEKVKKILN